MQVKDALRNALINYSDFSFNTVFGDLFTDYLDEPQHDVVSRMWNSMWHNYILNRGSVSTVYYSDLMNNKRVLNAVLKKLSLAGWIHVSTLPNRNWSEHVLTKTNFCL